MDNLARLLAFGPHAGEYARIRALLHVDMARIDGSGQEIGAPFAGFHIEPLNQIGAHIGTPCVFDPSPAINPVAELQLSAITNRRSHRHQIPESLSESRKLPTRFAEDPIF
jgi:hypothetical protein